MDIIKLLPRYILTFGFFDGLCLFLKVEWFDGERINIGGKSNSFRIRKGTTDKSVFREVFLFKGYNTALSNLQIIVDGGANIGLTSIFLKEKFPNSIIYSVEPSVSNFELLVENTKNFPSITPIQSALWPRDTSLKISNPKDHEWAFTVEECSQDQPNSFKAISISSLMEQNKLEYIDLLKLDIEGSERELFKENYDNWIRRTRHILVELHDWIHPDASRTVFKTLSKYNFKTTVVNGMLLFTNQDIQ
jgi:FkbM family methyltransferase